MNIVYIVPALIKQGPVLVVLELVKEMIKRGHHCEVYYFDTKYKDNLVEFPCETRAIKMSDSLQWDKIDVVHAHCIRSDWYVYRHKKEAKNTRFVSTIHNFMFQDLHRSYNIFVALLFTPLHLFLLRKPDIRVVLSKKAVEYYCRFFSKPLTYIYNSRSVDYEAKLTYDEEKELLDFKEGAKRLLGINAMLTPVKAVDVAIDALTFLDGYKLFIAGDGTALSDLKKRAIEKGVVDRVFFAGYKVDAFRYISYYDIYMMPSRSEGFPMALLEAMAFKCNAVISDLPVFKELFTEKEMTFSHLNDPKDCARAVIEATAHPKGEEAYKKYQESYSPKIFGDMYEMVYQGSNNPHLQES